MFTKSRKEGLFMTKKSFIALMGATIIGTTSLLGLGTSTANAMENTEQAQAVTIQESVAELIPTNFEKTLVKNESITPFATTSLSGSLKANQMKKTTSSYYLKAGEKVTIKSCTWSPSGQKIQLGFVNATNGKQYWTPNYSGGNITSGYTFSVAKAGEYHIAVGTPSTNTATVNVSAQFKLN